MVLTGFYDGVCVCDAVDNDSYLILLFNSTNTQDDCRVFHSSTQYHIPGYVLNAEGGYGLIDKSGVPPSLSPSYSVRADMCGYGKCDLYMSFHYCTAVRIEKGDTPLYHPHCHCTGQCAKICFRQKETTFNGNLIKTSDHDNFYNNFLFTNKQTSS